MQLSIKQGDITKLPVEVVVNAANNKLQAGGGVCGAIYKAAGTELHRATDKLWIYNNREVFETGTSYFTPSFNMVNCEGVIHTIGPIYNKGLGDDIMEQMLTDAYESAIALATEIGAKSIAFPAISTGIYGYPMDKAIQVVKNVLETTSYEGKIILVCFSNQDFRAYKREIKPWKIYLNRIKRTL